MSDDLVYLELIDTIGLVPSHSVENGKEVENPKAGELDVLHHIGLPISVPVAAGKDIVNVGQVYNIEPGEKLDSFLKARIIPGSRCVETSNPQVVNALVSSGQYVQVDKPRSEQARKPKSSEA